MLPDTIRIRKIFDKNKEQLFINVDTRPQQNSQVHESVDVCVVIFCRVCMCVVQINKHTSPTQHNTK